MDKRITEKTDMFGRVQKVCNDNIGTVHGIPKFKTYFEDFNKEVVQVDLLKVKLSTDNKGIAIGKSDCWDKLAMSLKGICASLRAYAIDTSDPVLRQKSVFSPTEFRLMRCGDAASLAAALLDLADAHAASLAAYNTPGTALTTARQQTEELTKLNPEPVTKITTDRALRKALFEAVAKANDLLRLRMDNMAETLGISDPVFYDEYFFARKMRHLGLRHLQPVLTTEASKKGMEAYAKTAAAATAEEPAAHATPMPSAQELAEKLGAKSLDLVQNGHGEVAA